MRKSIVIATVVAGALVVPGAAQAAGHSFEGSCTINGPSTDTVDGYVYRATGTCRGSLDGGATTAHPVAVVVRASGVSVPSLGLPIAVTFRGTTTFLGMDGPQDDLAIRFTGRQVGTAGLISGASGGQALLSALPEPDETATASVRTVGGPLRG